MILLKSTGANAHTVNLFGVALFFSYDACIGFQPKGGPPMVNADMIGLTSTTSKHINAAGLKGARAESEDAFASHLASALMRAADQI